jgi:CBS domain-containing protein/sporulation protein YlmC with PRC-barrel domain
MLGNEKTSVSALMGTAVLDAEGKAFGTVREFAVVPLTDSSRVEGLVVRLVKGGRKANPALVAIRLLERKDGQLRLKPGAAPGNMPSGDDYLLLERDLLDQQIIDVNGHKVVRVNDVDLVWERPLEPDANGIRPLSLRIAEVEVGLRGAARRLLKGLPESAIESVALRLRPAVIPWDFVDLIDRDPARRVRLKIEQDKLAHMHPSDLADILEDLAPAERQALFSSLDEEVAAEALEEVELKTQKRLIESIDSERLAGIIEEMDPGAAADLLSELPEERSDAILEEMNERERHEVEELLEYAADSAAGLMTPEFVAVKASASVEEALAVLRQFEGDLDSVTDMFLLDAEGRASGVVTLSRLLLAPRDGILGELGEGHMVSSGLEANGRKVAELFDKYNLRCLPVLDRDKRLVGVVHAEDVIAWLRTD